MLRITADHGNMVLVAAVISYTLQTMLQHSKRPYTAVQRLQGNAPQWLKIIAQRPYICCATVAQCYATAVQHSAMCDQHCGTAVHRSATAVQRSATAIQRSLLLVVPHRRGGMHCKWWVINMPSVGAATSQLEGFCAGRVTCWQISAAMTSHAGVRPLALATSQVGGEAPGRPPR